jgi:multidrug resistance efflux pump
MTTIKYNSNVARKHQLLLALDKPENRKNKEMLEELEKLNVIINTELTKDIEEANADSMLKSNSLNEARKNSSLDLKNTEERKMTEEPKDALKEANAQYKQLIVEYRETLTKIKQIVKEKKDLREKIKGMRAKK